MIVKRSFRPSSVKAERRVCASSDLWKRKQPQQHRVNLTASLCCLAVHQNPLWKMLELENAKIVLLCLDGEKRKNEPDPPVHNTVLVKEH